MSKRAPTLGDRLRSLREKKNLSQYDVATAAGIRPESLSRLETGKSQTATLASLHKLAPVLGCTIDDIIGNLAPATVAKKKRGKNA